MIDAPAPPPVQHVAAVPAPAAVSTVAFAPPVDRPLLFRVEERRDEGAGRRRFLVERRVRFRRDGPGWLAEVTLLRAWTDRDDAVARRFLAGVRALDGRVLRYRLVGDGRVAGVEAEDAVWAAMLGGFAAASRGSPVPGADLSHASPAMRAAMLESPVRSVLALAPPPPGVRRVRLPGLGPAGGPVALEGMERTAREADGLLTTVTDATSDGPPAVTLHRRRTTDPASGLMRHLIEDRRSEIGGRAIHTVVESSLVG